MFNKALSGEPAASAVPRVIHLLNEGIVFRPESHDDAGGRGPLADVTEVSGKESPNLMKKLKC